MKFPISCHEDNLKNLQISLEIERKKLLELEVKIMRMDKEVAFRRIQISEAYLRGLTEYDAEKFCVRKSK